MTPSNHSEIEEYEVETDGDIATHLGERESDSDDPNFLTQEDRNAISSDKPPETNQSEPVEIAEDTEEDNEHTELFDMQAIEGMISANTSSVRNIILSLDKVSQKAFNANVNIALYQDTPTQIAVEKRGTSKEINTFISINFDFGQMREKGEIVRGTEKLTSFDRIVLDAVHTLYFEGHNSYITPSMVFHVMTGDKDKFMSPKYAEEINNSLLKLLFTHITIDATEEAIMYPGLKDFKYHSTILPGDMVQAKLNGTETSCVHIHTKPVLYLYAKLKKQVSKIDLSIIKIPFANDRKENKEQMMLLYYLLRRIIALKSLQNKIKYETLYHEFGYDNAPRKNKFDLRKRAKAILDSWKGVIFGDIQLIDYTEEKDGKTPYEIILRYKLIKPEN